MAYLSHPPRESDTETRALRQITMQAGARQKYHKGNGSEGNRFLFVIKLAGSKRSTSDPFSKKATGTLQKLPAEKGSRKSRNQKSLLEQSKEH